MDHSFVRGARVKPKPLKPINEEISFPRFMLSMANYVVKDYGLKDKQRFLQFAAVAFDFAIQQDSATSTQTGEQNGK